MKNSFFIILLLSFLKASLHAEELFIEAKDVSLNKNNKTTIFKDDVVIKLKNKEIISQFAEYNKETEKIVLRKNIIAKDELNNIVKTEYAEYNKLKDTLTTVGTSTFTSSENYTLDGENLFFDNQNKKVRSKSKALLKDPDGNKIYLENFEYLINDNIFKSLGNIKIIDKLNNNYEFSQIYIDTKKKEILGTDIKALLKNQDFKVNKENDPRIFANVMTSDGQTSTFEKSIFTLCKYREGEKCPPWTLQASKMMHDNKTKTIYYDNAIIKVYDIPIFYLPYLSHPDPSVNRRSGFLPPSFSDSKNLGSSVAIPYFFDLDRDKNLTLTSKLFVDQHPLFLGEYHQAFKNSNLLTDFGFTEGYKKTSLTKKAGSKSHFFSKFVKNFEGDNGSDNSFSFTTQQVSNNKYLKLYKIESNLVNHSNDFLENSLDFKYSNDDLFFGINTSIYETLKTDAKEKYEYIFPEMTLSKNLLSDEKLGSIDFQSNLKVHNYETNKLSSFFVNEVNWESNNLILNSIVKNKFLGKFKNINYEAKNIDIYKDDPTTELFGAVGLLSEMSLKKNKNDTLHTLTPKMLIRFSPGSMRQEEEGSRLTYLDTFKMDRLENKNSFETGATATLGFDFNIKRNDIDKFDFSVAQIINEKENKKFASKTSLDEKLSDLVGKASYNINEKIKLNYEFAVDQNYQEFNYNDFGANINLNNLGLDFNYIEENKHIGNQQYLKTKFSYKGNNNSLITLENKRNLISNSSEFYDLSYEYINDCLRAGLVYRREFYNDSELEAENSLMFNITLVPFGKIDSPKINQ